mmetsp:Transcript_20184/g.63113  ORF Transcript_20184/g.63113 Transcript_20184/m.63113 type:complete len:220 (+) Transcript_20184:371-1030(+)
MVRPRRADVLQAVLAHQLLPCLNTHPDMWHQDLVLRHLHLGLPHDEPFAGVPLIAPVPVGIVVAALHAHDRLLVLAHGELLQVVVGLEHDLARARASQPGRLVTLCLPLAPGALRVQREDGVLPLATADLQGQAEVLQVHGRLWVARRRQVDAVGRAEPPQRQADEVGLFQLAAHERGWADVGGDELRRPADAVLRAQGILLNRVPALASLLLLPGFQQ